MYTIKFVTTTSAVLWSDVLTSVYLFCLCLAHKVHEHAGDVIHVPANDFTLCPQVALTRQAK